MARDNVITMWKDQGIWNDNWNIEEGCEIEWPAWRHEDPSESASDDEVGQKPSLLFANHRLRASKQKRHTTKQQAQQAVERRAARHRRREASRPVHQFLYQVHVASERLRLKLRCGAAAASAPNNVNTQAYEAVKQNWIERGIWDTLWGILPGMIRKHERAFESLDLKAARTADERCPPVDDDSADPVDFGANDRLSPALESAARDVAVPSDPPNRNGTGPLKNVEPANYPSSGISDGKPFKDSASVMEPKENGLKGIPRTGSSPSLLEQQQPSNHPEPITEQREAPRRKSRRLQDKREEPKEAVSVNGRQSRARAVSNPSPKSKPQGIKKSAAIAKKQSRRRK